jgi:hypothetical protein
MTLPSGKPAALGEQEMAWADLFEAGVISDPLVQRGSGERVAVRVPDAVVATLIPGQLPTIDRTIGRGAVLVTDRRVVLLNDDGGSEWRWDDSVGCAFAESHGAGLMIAPTAAAFATGTQLRGVLHPLLSQPTQPSPQLMWAGLFMWNRAAAGWYASRGELHIWRERTRLAFRTPSQLVPSA